jgi:hypothetical protein
MNVTKSAVLRLPVQAAVDRTATYATLAEGAGVEASCQPIAGRIGQWAPPKCPGL